MNNQTPFGQNNRVSVNTNAQQAQQSNQLNANISPPLFSNVQQPVSQPSLFTNAQQAQQQPVSNQGLFSQPQQQQPSLFSNAYQQQQQQQQPQILITNAQQQQNSNQQGFAYLQPPSLFFSNAQQQQMQNSSNQSNLSNLQSYNSSAQSLFQGGYQMPQVQQINNSGLFGYYQPQYHYQNQNSSELYNDDQPLIQKVKEEIKEGQIDISIKAQRSLVKLKNLTQLPAMVSLKSSGGSRTSVDLICVIDNSGSMQGQKIDLVKATVKFLLQALTPSDRLSIITFNSSSVRLCKLKCVSGENMGNFLQIVDSIQAGGGTNINSGLQLALKTIRDRKQVNKVTSIFLLSDGQNKGAQISFKNSLEQARNKQLGVFTLHSFGFGKDHDEDLMNKLCLLKDGAFYFIKQLATLDEAFCNALGGIISQVANQVIIKLDNIAKNLVEGVKIKKVYGKVWEKINDKQYRIKLSQLMSGITKDYVFEFQVPSINVQIGDLQRDHNIFQASFTAKGMSNQILKGSSCLQITLLNQNQNIPDTVQNVEVIQNFLRVKATEAIQQNLKKADQQKYKQAQAGIDNMIQCIQGNTKARKQKMATLVTDLQQIKQKCSQQDYGSEGRKIMTSIQTSHAMQNNFQYSNCVQSTMLNDLRSKRN